jgi:unsaturated rhamnogalacturonyl hydrolase
MRSVFFSGLSLSLLTLGCQRNTPVAAPLSDHILVVITRNYDRPSREAASIVLDWKQITSRLPQLNSQGFSVIDQHFGKLLEAHLIDSDGNGRPDNLRVIYPFTSAEPQYTLMIKANPELKSSVEESVAVSDKRFKITYLTSYTAYAKNDSLSDWPQRIFKSSLNFYPDPSTFTIISPGEWTYEHGLFLSAGFELWQRTHRQDYLDYMKAWTNLFLTPEGRIKSSAYDRTQYRLDDILPGRLCIFLYQETGDQRYKVAADQLIDQLRDQPKTSDGGYWHKQIYPHQMWLDGIYMADIFSMQYANAFGDPQLFDESVRQIELISKHTKDPQTGLMYHGWDESRNPVWADSITGASPSFWGRAIGWYLMAVVDCLDYLPENHPERENLIMVFKDLSKSLARYQDEKTGLWFQVIDKGDRQGNWLETSCSAMFAYGFAKGFNKGLLDSSYRDRAGRAFDGIIKYYTYYDNDGNLYLNQTVKVGTLNMKVSKGDYDYYISSERRINDYKGLGALLYASLALSEE